MLSTWLNVPLLIKPKTASVAACATASLGSENKSTICMEKFSEINKLEIKMENL